MSHNVMIEGVKIANLDALRAAIAELQKEGVAVSLNEASRRFRTYRGQPDQCDICIELTNESFDVGLVKQPDGTYVPVFDDMLDRNRSVACEWRSGDQHNNRHAIGKLVQRYAVVTTEMEAALQGHTSIRAKTDNGDMQVIVEMA